GVGPLPEQEVEGVPAERGKPAVPRTPRDFRLKVPGASCEPVRFRPTGDRHYDESVAQVENGKLRFGKPENAARRVGFNVTLAIGGGPAFSTHRSPGASSQVYFSGLGMFALEIRPRKPKFSRIAVEARFGGTLGRYATTIDESPGDGGPKPIEPPNAKPDTQTVGWARLLVEPGLVVSAHERVAIGFGFGLGMALPFRNTENLVGDRLRFIYSPNVDLRFRVRRWLKLVVQFRGVLNEQAFAQGNPVGDPGDAWAGSFITLFGVQAAF
ncbi:MAG: hypothetical protein IAG13_16625, partial [Deltaproteobacteria bacterium]|nr:hypothetical protein [Nannocystaceae bacterium]